MKNQIVRAYFRKYNRNPFKMFGPENVAFVVINVPVNATVAQMLEVAHAAGAPTGTHQNGIFQLETELGVWQRQDQMRIDVSTDRRAEKVQFSSFEDLQREGFIRTSARQAV